MTLKDLDLIKIASEAALDKKATRLIVLDLKMSSDLCRYQLICSGLNEMQTKAISESITKKLKEVADLRPLKVEGQTTGQWILMDYGATNIHIFFEPVRDFYALESLWPKAQFLDLKEINANHAH